MKATIQIDDDLYRALFQFAAEENISLSEACNRMLRCGLTAANEVAVKQRFHQEVFCMGVPNMPLTKALSLASELEDHERISKFPEK